MIDGNVINQFDNSIPKINTRAGDPPTMARQFAQGFLGLQTHGGNDRISYREIQVKEVAPADIPVNTVAPSITGSGFQGNALRCNHGTWNTAAGSEYFVKWYRSNKVLPTNPRYRAPSATDLGNFSDPGRPALRHAGADVDRLAAGRRGRHVHADGRGRRQGHPLRGQRQQRRRDGVEDGAGAGDPLRHQRHPGRGRHGAGHAEPHARHAGVVRRLHPGVTRTYDASTTANVISTAGDAALTVSDPSSPPPAAWSTARSRSRSRCRRRGLEPCRADGQDVPAPVSNDAVAVELQAADQRERRAPHRRVQQDADVHVVHDSAVKRCGRAAELAALPYAEVCWLTV